MDALISAQAGTALLIEGTKLASIHAHAPEQAIPRRAEEVHLLFGEGLDLQVLQGVDRDQVVRRLSREADATEALQLALILLDPEMPEEIRTEAAEELDGLLAEGECREGLERILYAHPFPSDADLPGAVAHSKGHTHRVQVFLHHLAEIQPAIAGVHRAWIGLPDKLFADTAERRRLQSALVREGVFREIVLTCQVETSEFFLLNALHNLKTFSRYTHQLAGTEEPPKQDETGGELEIEPDLGDEWWSAATTTSAAVAKQMLQERLHAEGLEATGLVEEILAQGSDLMARYLREGGSAEHLKRLFQSFCVHILECLLNDWRQAQVSEFMGLLEGEISLESYPLDRDPSILEKVRSVIDQLPHPFRGFLILDLVATLPEEAIRERLHLADHEEYLQLRRLSLAALRREIGQSVVDWKKEVDWEREVARLRDRLERPDGPRGPLHKIR